MLTTGETIAGKYRVERLLGEGGMGTVYAATNLITGRMVALKLLRPELSLNAQYGERLLREARVAGRLDHPNIVNIFDAGLVAGSLYLVMELLRGASFEEWLRRGRQPHSACIALLMPALRGVAAAHEAGIIHRDLKPDNIWLCMARDGVITQVKVLDFGIAKELDSALDPEKSLTSPGVLVGTINYMSPEQVRAAHSVDVRCDVYALGVILYHALAGRQPFGAETLPELILEIAEGKPVHLSQVRPDLPPGLADVVMRAMARDQSVRIQSVAELGRALEPYSGGVKFESREYLLSSEAPTLISEERGTSDPVARTPAPNAPRRPRLLWVALGLAALTVFVVAAWQLRTTSASAEDPKAASEPAATGPAPIVPTPTVEPASGEVPGAAPVETAVSSGSPETVAKPSPNHPSRHRGPPAKRGPAGSSPSPGPSAAPRGAPANPSYEDNPYIRH
jgi:eukaryotic-like serine/threonine-protein kinase